MNDHEAMLGYIDSAKEEDNPMELVAIGLAMIATRLSEVAGSIDDLTTEVKSGIDVNAQVQTLKDEGY